MDWSSYIDFTSGGIFAGVLGAGSKVVREELGRVWANDGLICSYGHRYPSEAMGRYVEELKEWTGYGGVALFTTGSEATEAFWRVARVYTGKPGIWGGLVDPDEVGKTEPGPTPDAMHGWTLGGMVMAKKVTIPALGKLEGYDLGDGLFGTSPEATCGMIMEPYHAASGQFHRVEPTINRVLARQKEFEMLLCLDEVQGGFGRTGKKFGYEWYEGLKPDFVCVGKAMGGGMPISALLGPKEVMESEVVKEHGHLHSTHSGHPVMCAVASAVLREIKEKNLVDVSFFKGMALADELKGCGVRFHAGRGLLAGLEFRDAAEAKKVVEACERRKLLVVDTGRKWVKLGPPFVISDEDLVEGCRRLKGAIEEVLSERETAADTAHGAGGSETSEGAGVLGEDGGPGTDLAG